MRIVLKLQQNRQVRPHSYNGYLTPFEKRAVCTIKQWCYKKR